jgi:formylglycine-generating enzyme
MNKLTRQSHMRNIFAALALLAAPLAHAAVTVTNVTATQIEGTKTVRITYDVASTETATVAVSLEVKNGGTRINATSLTGHVGVGVATGTGKTIVWNGGADWNGNAATLNYTVRADDGQVPAGLVLVQGGTTAGITVSSFCIGKYEVTWGEWQTVRTYAAANGYDIGSVGGGSGNDHPVYNVSWYDVVKWCNAKSEMEGRTPCYTVGGATYKAGEYEYGSGVVACNFAANGYRLPTSAEWEFGARGGTQSLGYTYSGGNDLNVVGWYWDNSGGGPHVVGTKAANELGLHDMSGNVVEWCWDANSSKRAVLGGAWRSTADGCAVSYRWYSYPFNRGADYYGFRLAWSAGG